MSSVFFKATLVLTLLVPPAQAVHHGHEWFDNYEDEHGIKCCGASDCTRVMARMIAVVDKEIVVEIDGRHVKMSRKAIHPSETQDAWVCRRDYRIKRGRCGAFDSDCIRCVFLVTGG